ncbi:NUDIX hydrolase [Desulfobacterales bacterium HSG16]|nr:NUDIX hydrolase [Desulfobacterales bacterium HSG16]
MKSETNFRNPFPTVDIIIEIDKGFILIKRKNPPFGWALPGGFVDYGESLESAAIREAKEETSLDIRLMEQFHTYSAPDRDPRHHTLTTVYIAAAQGIPEAADDAKDIGIFHEEDLPQQIAFDHDRLIEDYLRYRKGDARIKIFPLSP